MGRSLISRHDGMDGWVSVSVELFPKGGVPQRHIKKIPGCCGMKDGHLLFYDPYNTIILFETKPPLCCYIHQVSNNCKKCY